MKASCELAPEFRSRLLQLADAVERDLGISGSSMAIVVHGARMIEGEMRYDLSLASDDEPTLIRAMRNAFPRHKVDHLRATIGQFGDLNLENVALTDIEAALARRADTRNPSR